MVGIILLLLKNRMLDHADSFTIREVKVLLHLQIGLATTIIT